jgi:hypothetical protein
MTVLDRRGPPREASPLWAVIFLAAGLAAACRSASPALSHTFDSPEALASAVIDGLSRGDAAGLAALALSEDEFRHHVWPGLPVSRPERNMPFEYVWKDLKTKSRAHLAARLKDPGIRQLAVREVVFDGEATEYPGFTVLRKARLLVRDPAGGGERSVRLFGSVLRKDGRYKLFSYVVD